MTERMEPAELNKRLAGLLGVELGARTDGEIDAAIDSFIWPTMAPSVWIWAHRMMWQSKADGSARSDFLHLWDNREGQPYQADLEAHVAAWQRDPPNYAGDLQAAFGLGVICSERYCWAAFLRELSQIILEDGEDVNQSQLEFGLAHASAYDRALAAYRALGGEE